MKQRHRFEASVPLHNIKNSHTHINRSKSKETFSFSKSPRFQTIQPYCAKDSYKIDGIQRKNSGMSIGKARRPDFTATTTVSPGASKYNLKTLFDDKQTKAKGYSLRMSRQKINFGSYINKEAISVPPPTRYDNDKKERIRSPSYSLRPRTRVLDKSKTLEAQNSNPGPGYYQNPQISINSKNASKFSNIGYSSSRSKRFLSDDNYVPGPGNYKQVSSLSKVGKYVLSNHSGGTKAIFDHQKRVSKFDQVRKQSKEKPGPGSYRLPSEFGQYDGDIYPSMGTITSSRYSRRLGSRKD